MRQAELNKASAKLHDLTLMLLEDHWSAKQRRVIEDKRDKLCGEVNDAYSYLGMTPNAN